MSRILPAWAALSALVSIAPLRAQQYTGPLDNVEGSFVQLATFPVRPMLHDGGEIWAVNHHNDSVEVFDASSPGCPTDVIGVPWGPVSIALWEGTGPGSGDDEILVVCRGTWAVVRIGRTSKAIVGLVQPSPRHGDLAEPGDILVDQDTGMAFVSCMGADAVVQIDLASNEIVHTFHESSDPAFRMKSPLFLSFLEGGGGKDVLVAPLHSGNNTIWTGPVPASLSGLNRGTTIRDLSDPSVAEQGLPDEDLFRIVPWRSFSASGSVSVLATGLGTTLLAHGQNPATGRVWVLNTDARNRDVPADNDGNQGEPAVAGRFVNSRISSVDPSTSSKVLHDLDPVGMSPQAALAAGMAVGHPYALDFNPHGQAFVTGLLTSNVMILSKNGVPLLEWDLFPVEGPCSDPSSSPFSSPKYSAIPRGILVSSTASVREGTVLVYCWGDNTIREFAYDLAVPSAAQTKIFRLSHDPTPEPIRRGRETFFNGSRSLFGNVSCASCHIEGGTDFLAWNLSDNRLEHPDGFETLSVDDKGGMVTQTMVGLERLAPFHWRGERTLEDFNAFAFTGLLGAGAPLDEADFADFKAYVFSLRNPANPRQDRERILSDALQPSGCESSSVVANPTHGQVLFHGDDAFFEDRFSCNACHAAPTGTNNDIHDEVFGIVRPRRSHLKPAAFHELWRKQQSCVEIELIGPNSTKIILQRGFLGQGLAHTGEFRDLQQFVDQVARDRDAQERRDLHAFIDQWDQGLAPAVHFAFRLDGSDAQSVSRLVPEVRDYVQAQADVRNCDLAVLTELPSGGTLRWYYDRLAPNGSGGTGLYVSEDPLTSPRVLADFAAATSESSVFVGLPVGMGERWAIDHDLDGLLNAVDPDPHVPGAGPVNPILAFTVPPEAMWVTTRTARIRFETSQPTTAVVRYRRLGHSQERTVLSPVRSRAHTVILPDLHASTVVDEPAGNSWLEPEPTAKDIVYEVLVEVTDSQQTVVGPTVTFSTDPFITPPDFAPGNASQIKNRQRLTRSIVSGVSLVTGLLSDAQGTYVHCEVNAQIAFQRGGDYDSGTGEFVRPPAPRRIVVGRVFAVRGGLAKQVTTKLSDVSNKTFFADNVELRNRQNEEIRTLRVQGDQAPSGPFLAAKNLSNSAGVVTLEFEFRNTAALGLQAGDEVYFVIDAVIEIPYVEGSAENPPPPEMDGQTLVIRAWHPSYDANGSSFPPEDQGFLALTQWDFPDSKEENSLAKDTL